MNRHAIWLIFGMILLIGLSKLYQDIWIRTCPTNPDSKNLAEMMEALPSGAHSVPNGLEIIHENLNWVAPSSYELHVYPSTTSHFLRVSGPKNGHADCLVKSQDGLSWLVFGIPDPYEVEGGGPSSYVMRYIQRDSVVIKAKQ